MTSAPADNSNHEIEFNNGVSTIQVGSEIHIDGWCGAVELKRSDWSGSEFKLPSHAYPESSYAINVRIVGRKARRVSGFSTHVVRVKVEIINDDGGSNLPCFILGWWKLWGSK